jgi:hypothetical protein
MALLSMAALFLGQFVPAMAAGIGLCTVIPEPAMEAHACCLTPEATAPAGMDHGTLRHDPSTALHADTAIHAEGTDDSHEAHCACLPASSLPHDEADVAIVSDTSTPRTAVPQGVAAITHDTLNLTTHALPPHLTDEARRFASGPPLYLLHDFLLI